jgi:hypothetical protein
MVGCRRHLVGSGDVDNPMTSIRPQPAAPPERPFQFSLRTMLLLCVVLGSSLAVFGAWGVIAALLGAWMATYVGDDVATRSSLAKFLSMVLCLPCLLVFLEPKDPNWPYIAALWLLSVGTLLKPAVQSTKARSCDVDEQRALKVLRALKKWGSPGPQGDVKDEARQ